MQSSRSNITRKSDTGIWLRIGFDRAARHAFDLPVQLGMVLDKSISVRAFRQWFVNSQWDIELEGADDTVDLMNLIELRLAELTSGYLSEDLLLETLRADLVQYSDMPAPGSVHFDFADQSVEVTVRSIRELLPPHADGRLVAEFVTAPAH